jgi:hypothetical protein
MLTLSEKVSNETFTITLGTTTELVAVPLSSRAEVYTCSVAFEMLTVQKLHIELVAAFERNGICGQAALVLQSGNYHFVDDNGRFVTKEAWPSISKDERLKLVLHRQSRFPTQSYKIQATFTARNIILIGGDSLVQFAERYPQGIGPYLRNGEYS